jgi:hypothetical protein
MSSQLSVDVDGPRCLTPRCQLLDRLSPLAVPPLARHVVTSLGHLADAPNNICACLRRALIKDSQDAEARAAYFWRLQGVWQGRKLVLSEWRTGLPSTLAKQAAGPKAGKGQARAAAQPA